MRKLAAALILSLCIGLLSGCASKADPETLAPGELEITDTQDIAQEEVTEGFKSPMEDLQQLLHDEEKLCAVAYLGVCEGDFAKIQEYLITSGLMAALPFLEEMSEENFVATAGTELYLVIQRENVGITVYEQALDEQSCELSRGKSLYVGFEAQPLLVQGNVSDIIPNLGLFLQIEGAQSVEYSLCLSMQDGEIVEHEAIYDLSQYHLLPNAYSEPVVGGEDVRIGTWFATVQTGSGETMILELMLDYDGRATYGYGLAEAEYSAYYDGTWHEDGEKIVLELYGGANESDEYVELNAEVEWEYVDRALQLRHVGGASLISDGEGAAFAFYRCSQYAIVGLWATSEYDSQTDSYFQYDLELMEGGICSLLMHDGQGSTFVAYEGTWSIEQGVLKIAMEICREYEQATKQHISASLAAAIDTMGSLSLELLSGDALTNYMSQYDIEYFEPLISYG